MRGLLDEQERSGLSLKAFADAAGVPYTTLATWRARLRRGSLPRFVPVRVQEGDPALEVVVGDVVVRVPAGTSAVAAARLVRTIASC